MKILKYSLICFLSFFLISCAETELADTIPLNDMDPSGPGDPIDCFCGGGGGSGGGTGGTTWPDFYYTHRGDGSNNLYFSSSTDGINYNSSQVGLGAQTREGSSGVIFNDKMYIYYRGSSSSNIFVAYKNSINSSWLGNTWINNVSKTNKELSAVVHDNKVFLAHMGETNGALYLNYSSDGTSFTQVQALGSGNDVKQFAMTSDGTNIYIFWTKTTDNFLSRVSYTWSSTPTDPSSWQGNVVTDLKDPNNDAIQAQNGLSATVVNGNIHLVWARENDGDLLITPALPDRYIQWGKISTPGDQALSSIKIYPYEITKRRPGAVYNGSDKIIISYTGNSSDRINTFHISPLSGTILFDAGETGGEAKVGGVFSFKR